MHGTVSLRSVHGKFLSAQPDGRAEWNRDEAHDWEHFHVEKRHNGKITLKGVHGMYLSAQPDGAVQINRREAPPGGWEEFTVEDRGNNVVCLKSCHGKYLSAQQDGTAQWNRDHAPRGGWEDIQFVQQGATGQQQPATTTASMPSYVIVAQAGSSEVNGNYEFVPGKHENRHWGTVAGHYQHTQNPEIFIAFQDCGKDHQRPEWNKWMIISKIGVLYAAHTGGKIGVPPREGGWETVDSWGNPGAPGGKHPAPTLYHPARAEPSRIQPAPVQPSVETSSIDILEAVSSKPVRFKINNPPSSNDAWVGIYPAGAPDQDHGEQNKRWKWLHDMNVNDATLPPQAEGNWSIRIFSDGGFTLHERKDFFMLADGHPLPPSSTSRSPKRESIEILEAVPGKPVRFRINDVPSSNDSWVGIYHPSSSDQEHGEQKKRWEWLRDLDVNNASLPEQSEGNWSIRVFSDGGYRLHERKDFAVEPKREAFSLPTESSSPTYIGKPWHKLSKEEKESYPVSEGSLSLPSALSVVLGVPWFLFAFFVWQLPFLNTIWLGKCAYCPEAEFQNGEIWWGLLTPIANFGAVMPFLLGFLFLWWSIFPTPEWRRNEMAGWLFALPFATFWFMLALISFDLLTWVEGSLGISDNYDMGSRELYWTFSWIAIPAVGSVALLPTYYCLKAIFLGIHNSPPPPFQGELGSRILHEGNKGKDVSRLQELLNKMSNSNLTVDGHFGSQTKAALMNFERKNNLETDGVLDPLALALLDKSEPNTREELVELIDLIISVIDPKDKGESRDTAESIFENLMRSMPFNMKSSARQIWKEKFGVSPTLEVLQWWK